MQGTTATHYKNIKRDVEKLSNKIILIKVQYWENFRNTF